MKYGSRQTRKQIRQRQKRARTIAFLLVITGVLGLTGYLLASAFSRPALDPVAGNIFDIAADMGGFDQGEIRVRPASRSLSG